MKNSVLFILIISLLQISCTDPKNKSTAKDKLYSTNKICTVYRYSFKFGELDTNSKFKKGIILYDDNRKKVEEIELNTDSSKKIIKYSDKEKIIEEVKYNIDTSIISKLINKYNDKGNLIEALSYNGDGSLYGKEIYTYDNTGNLIEKEKYISNNLIKKNTYKYDNKGYMIEEVSGQNRTSYKYDSKGYKTEAVMYGTRSSLGERVKPFSDNAYERMVENIKDIKEMINIKYIYKYDNNGNLIEQIKYNEKGIMLWKKTNKYEYDGKGNMIEENYFLDGSFESKKSYKFDDIGNKISEIIYNRLNEPEEQTEYVYSK